MFVDALDSLKMAPRQQSSHSCCLPPFCLPCIGWQPQRSADVFGTMWLALVVVYSSLVLACMPMAQCQAPMCLWLELKTAPSTCSRR